MPEDRPGSHAMQPQTHICDIRSAERWHGYPYACHPDGHFNPDDRASLQPILSQLQLSVLATMNKLDKILYLEKSQLIRKNLKSRFKINVQISRAVNNPYKSIRYYMIKKISMRREMRVQLFHPQIPLLEQSLLIVIIFDANYLKSPLKLAPCQQFIFRH